jgi:hypothetical protein
VIGGSQGETSPRLGRHSRPVIGAIRSYGLVTNGHGRRVSNQRTSQDEEGQHGGEGELAFEKLAHLENSLVS